MPEVIVAGAGVVGLTAAIRLREAGIAADVVARDPPAATTSAVAAALWYPYRAFPRERVGGVVGARVRGAERPRRRRPAAASGCAGAPSSSRPDARGSVVADGGAVVRAHGRGLSGSRRRSRTCRSTCRGSSRGSRRSAARWRSRTLDSLDAALARAPVVVNCAGLGARELAGDDALLAVRGQILHVEQTGVDEWLLDQSDPERLLYVVPRERDVVLGGTAQEGDEDVAVDPATAAAIRARCEAAVPALRGARVLREAVGLRPARPAVRLETEARADGTIVHCYGHGGAGVTLAWGCAEEVTALVAPVAGLM